MRFRILGLAVFGVPLSIFLVSCGEEVQPSGKHLASHGKSGPAVTFLTDGANGDEIVRSIEVRRGETVTTLFDFESTGDRPLEIRSIEKTCGCTTARIAGDTKKYSPGRRGAIELVIDTSEKRGASSASAIIHTNGNTAKLTVQLNVTTPGELNVSPELIDFEPAFLGHSVNRHVVVDAFDLGEAETHLEFSDVNLDVRRLTVDRLSTTHTRVRFLVTLRPSSAVLEELPREGVGRVFAFGSETRESALPYRYVLTPNIAASPASLFLGEIQPNESFREIVDIKPIGESTGYVAKSVEALSSSPTIDVSIQPSDTVPSKLTIAGIAGGVAGIHREVITIQIRIAGGEVITLQIPVSFKVV